MAKGSNMLEGNKTLWEIAGPECDSCGRPEYSLRGKKQLLSCAGCLVSKYCSKECQKKDWGETHRDQCHLFEANRKLSSVFAKSLGPGTINDPKLDWQSKLNEWNFLNVANHVMIASAALQNNQKVAANHNVAIMLSVSPEHVGSKYENRTFFIDRVALLQRDVSDADAYETPWEKGGYKDSAAAVESLKEHGKRCFKIFVGFCKLPDGTQSRTQMWSVPCFQVELQDMPPGFDLNRYIPHVNRGITHFHASFWPLPRNISDADLESAEAPGPLVLYTFTQHQMLSGLKGGQNVVGELHADGSHTPRYKFCKANGHFRACAPGETDYDGPVEYRKALENPSRMACLLSKHLDHYEQMHRSICGEGPDPLVKETIVRVPRSGKTSFDQAIEDMKNKMCPGR
ncbi:hypothetical protein FB45DRAFT_1008611 [Roridomyces roridus]|uniref:MYND-type domain-containing protein n=1 Tax=Roridomyces roridus TaxID=1738132 RepID=A0AAD7B985_9AGAR|nr:hypothetical protein FB45DRAFT_1008611 [Roridomyces roridus]